MNQRILVVDDDVHLCEPLWHLIRRRIESLEVQFASSLEGAMRTLRSNGPFDLVVSDRHMDNLYNAARELLTRIRAGESESSTGTPRDVPVACLSVALPRDESDLEGFVFYRTKTTLVESLVDAVRGALRSA